MVPAGNHKAPLSKTWLLDMAAAMGREPVPALLPPLSLMLTIAPEYRACELPKYTVLPLTLMVCSVLLLWPELVPPALLVRAVEGSILVTFQTFPAGTL